MAYRGKYPNRISSVSSISLFPGRYMITTNAGAKYTVDGKALDSVRDHLKADVSAFPTARLLTATAATRGDDFKALSVTLTYADGETVTHTPEIERALKSHNVCMFRGGKWQIVNPVPFASFREARKVRDALLSNVDECDRATLDYEIHSVAVCDRCGITL